MDSYLETQSTESFEVIPETLETCQKSENNLSSGKCLIVDMKNVKTLTDSSTSNEDVKLGMTSGPKEAYQEQGWQGKELGGKKQSNSTHKISDSSSFSSMSTNSFVKVSETSLITGDDMSHINNVCEPKSAALLVNDSSDKARDISTNHYKENSSNKEPSRYFYDENEKEDKLNLNTADYTSMKSENNAEISKSVGMYLI